MPTTVTLVLVVVFSVLASAALARYAGHRVVLSGAEYLVVGMLLGPLGLQLLDDRVMELLQPFVSVILGVVGFSLGLALRHRLQSGSALGAGLLGTGMVAFLVAGGCGQLFRVAPLQGLIPGDGFWLAIVLGATAAAVSMHFIESSALAYRAAGPTTELLRSFALGGSVFAVVASGTAIAISRAGQASNTYGLTPTEWLVALAVLGVACGLLFAMFMGRAREEDDRLFLAAVGIIAFGSGVGLAAGMSPLLLNALSGLIISLVSGDATDLHRKLTRLERPATVTLMILAGALWQPTVGLLWLLPPLYLVLRVVLLQGATSLALRAFTELPRIPRLGSGLIAQGSVAVAVAVNYAQVFPEQSAVMLSTVLGAVVAGDLMSSGYQRALLADVGELDRAVGDPAGEPGREEVA
ncbi:MAG: hypothetical protein ABIJ09_21245 [Pseudomonadota bacterium]